MRCNETLEWQTFVSCTLPHSVTNLHIGENAYPYKIFITIKNGKIQEGEQTRLPRFSKIIMCNPLSGIETAQCCSENLAFYR